VFEHVFDLVSMSHVDSSDREEDVFVQHAIQVGGIEVHDSERRTSAAHNDPLHALLPSISLKHADGTVRNESDANTRGSSSRLVLPWRV